MEISRRSVMLSGAVIGAGVIANSTPSIKALAQGQPPERRTLQGLAWNDPIVATYRTMPEVFVSPTTPDGKKNWLFVDDQDFGQHWRRTWPATKPMPRRIVG